MARRSLFASLVVFLLLLVAAPAKADFVYTLYFPAQNDVEILGQTFSYEADSFSFTVLSVITTIGGIGEEIPTPGAELNGYAFSSLRTNAYPVDSQVRRFFYQSEPVNIGLPLGVVSGFQLRVDTNPVDVGFYQAEVARVVGLGEDHPGIAQQWTQGGSLTIAAVPEPASLLLFATGLVALSAARRRRRKDLVSG